MKYVIMAGEGFGYGDALCLLSVIQDLADHGARVAVVTKHPEVYSGQRGVEKIYHTSGALGMWEEWCKDTDEVFYFPYWEKTGRMRGLGDTLLNYFRDRAAMPKANKFPDFTIGQSDLDLVDGIIEKLPLPVLAVHRGRGREIKLLPLKVMESLVQELSNKYSVVQVGYQYDVPINGVLDLRGQLSFRASMAMLMRARMIVGHDSMPAHASGIVGTPGVFVYGPTSPEDFGYGHNENIFNGRCSQELSGPCGRPAVWHFDYVAKPGGGYADWDCPDRVCMTSIRVQEIMDKVELLEARIESGIDWTPRRG